ncbi:MAG: hypothetical protein H7Z41_13470 [Cytophagales bacterium]|nr:hypothetical protein [Armatimonadota bacterium]
MGNTRLSFFGAAFGQDKGIHAKLRGQDDPRLPGLDPADDAARRHSVADPETGRAYQELSII